MSKNVNNNTIKVNVVLDGDKDKKTEKEKEKEKETRERARRNRMGRIAALMGAPGAAGGGGGGGTRPPMVAPLPTQAAPSMQNVFAAARDVDYTPTPMEIDPPGSYVAKPAYFTARASREQQARKDLMADGDQMMSEAAAFGAATGNLNSMQYMRAQQLQKEFASQLEGVPATNATPAAIVRESAAQRDKRLEAEREAFALSIMPPSRDDSLAPTPKSKVPGQGYDLASLVDRLNLEQRAQAMETDNERQRGRPSDTGSVDEGPAKASRVDNPLFEQGAKRMANPAVARAQIDNLTKRMNAAKTDKTREKWARQLDEFKAQATAKFGEPF